jgi:uncharacterized protein YecE (DUF72 family)
MIRVGIGGWTFAPWRSEFYPKGLPQARELQHASRSLTSIEINGTFYRTQKPESFRKWADETPDDFVFSVKGPQFATNRRMLAEAGESIDRFFASGVLELKSKLGPILWQLNPHKKFDPEDIAAFLALLPKEREGRTLRHVIEARDKSFAVPDYVKLLRQHAVAPVLVDSEKHALIADATADFLYLRLQRTQPEVPTGYTDEALEMWAERAKVWAEGGAPDDLPPITDPARSKSKRDVFVYMISGAKVRAPAAAMALIKKLK